MTGAIFWQTVRNRRTSWMIYSVIGLLSLLLYLATFPAVQSISADYNKILATMPKALLQAFNISQSSLTLMGYLTSKHFGLVWPVMMIFLMTSYSGGAMAKEIDTRSMGLLLSLPVSRLRLYLVRVLAGATGLAVFVILTEAVTWPLAKLFNFTLLASDIINLGILGFCFGLAILGLGMMFSSLVSESGKSAGAMAGLVLAMYIINIVAQLDSKLKDAKFISLFHYFLPGSVVDGGHLDMVSLAVLIGVGVAAAAVGAWVFVRRDVSV